MHDSLPLWVDDAAAEPSWLGDYFFRAGVGRECTDAGLMDCADGLYCGVDGRTDSRCTWAKKIEAERIVLRWPWLVCYLSLRFRFSVFSAGQALRGYGVSKVNNGGLMGSQEIVYGLRLGLQAIMGSRLLQGFNATPSGINITIGLAMLIGRFLMIISDDGLRAIWRLKKKMFPFSGHVPSSYAPVCGVADRYHTDRWGAHFLPDAFPWPDRRTFF